MLPSGELTYLLWKALSRQLSFSQVGYVSSLEGYKIFRLTIMKWNARRCQSWKGNFCRASATKGWCFSLLDMESYLKPGRRWNTMLRIHIEPLLPFIFSYSERYNWTPKTWDVWENMAIMAKICPFLRYCILLLFEPWNQPWLGSLDGGTISYASSDPAVAKSAVLWWEASGDKGL